MCFCWGGDGGGVEEGRGLQGKAVFKRVHLLPETSSIITFMPLFQLSVDMSEIQFGTTVIDETLKRTFTLTNTGALGTKFDFFKVTGE